MATAITEVKKIEFTVGENETICRLQYGSSEPENPFWGGGWKTKSFDKNVSITEFLEAHAGDYLTWDDYKPEESSAKIELPATGQAREIFDHKNNEFNRKHVQVLAVDEKASDNANHRYRILVWSPSGYGERLIAHCAINFQNGGLKEVGPNGITDQALIAIALDRLRSFNEGPYRCRENSIAITKLEEALLWGGKRASDRAARGVEGERKE